MTRDELIAHLKTLPEDVVFLLSSDEEGNSYRELYTATGLGLGYDGPDGWQPMHPDDIASGEYDQEDIDAAKHICTFW